MHNYHRQDQYRVGQSSLRCNPKHPEQDLDLLVVSFVMQLLITCEFRQQTWVTRDRIQLLYQMKDFVVSGLRCKRNYFQSNPLTVNPALQQQALNQYEYRPYTQSPYPPNAPRPISRGGFPRQVQNASMMPGHSITNLRSHLEGQHSDLYAAYEAPLLAAHGRVRSNPYHNMPAGCVYISLKIP